MHSIIELINAVSHLGLAQMAFILAVLLFYKYEK
jgi:hypothetical protein